MLETSHLRDRVWTASLENANLDYREMKKTRHSFATIVLCSGENPLWIAYKSAQPQFLRYPQRIWIPGDLAISHPTTSVVA